MGGIRRGRWPVVRRAPLRDARRTTPAGPSTGRWSEALQRAEPNGGGEAPAPFRPCVSARGRGCWPQVGRAGRDSESKMAPHLLENTGNRPGNAIAAQELPGAPWRLCTALGGRSGPEKPPQPLENTQTRLGNERGAPRSVLATCPKGGAAIRGDLGARPSPGSPRPFGARDDGAGAGRSRRRASAPGARPEKSPQPIEKAQNRLGARARMAAEPSGRGARGASRPSVVRENWRKALKGLNPRPEIQSPPPRWRRPGETR